MKTIVIIVSPQGNSSLETRGFSGTGCRDASRFLEQALGKTAEEKLTTEFFRSDAIEPARQTESNGPQP